jgi:hypothetical protein
VKTGLALFALFVDLHRSMPVEDWLGLPPDATPEAVKAVVYAWDAGAQAGRLWAKMEKLVLLEALPAFEGGGAEALSELGYTAEDLRKAAPKGQGFPPERFALRDPSIRRLLSITVGADIKGIRDSTRARITESILRGFSGNFGPERMTQQIRKIVRDRQRAELIARTELKRARQTGRLMTFRMNGVMYKEWITQSGACSRCRANEAAGPIDIGWIFPSGDTAPPLHPRCRCKVSPFSRQCWVGSRGRKGAGGPDDPCQWNRPDVPWAGGALTKREPKDKNTGDAGVLVLRHRRASWCGGP